MILKTTPKLCALILIVISLSGCQINKHATLNTATIDQLAEVSEASADQEIAPENQIPEYLPGALRVDPAADLVANPTTFGKFKGRATRQLKDFYTLDDRRCHGFLEPKPALVFNKPGTSNPYKITAHGDIDVLFVEFSDREILCQRRLEDGQDPVIEISDSRGRAYKIYGGRFKKRAPTDFSLTFENLGQPLNVNWLDAEVPALTIDSDLTPPKFHEINLAGAQNSTRSAAHGNDSCSATPGRFTYALVPEIRIDIKQTAAVTLGVRSVNPVHMTLVGPIPEDRRDIPTRCLANATETLELEAGTYYIRLGFPADAASLNENINFFVHGAATALDPLTHFENTPANLHVNARALSLHYPFLDANVLLTNDSVGSQLFSTAPPSLYVVATEDITSQQGASIFQGETRPEDTLLKDNRPTELPKKDELLLLLNPQNVVLAADGSIFVIPENLLKPAEQADVITLPTTARNPQTFFRNALLLADDSDQGRLEQYTQRQERYQQCVTKTASDTHAPDSAHVTKTCGLTRLTDENNRLWRQLEDNRTVRRNDALKIVRTRLADLVLVK